MKFNWGHGLVTAIVLGIIGILSLVFVTTKERIDLVTEDYYPKELKYEDQITKLRNYKALDQKITLEEQGVLWVQFPQLTSDASEIKGVIHVYRPSDKDMDLTFPVSLSGEFRQAIPLQGLERGKYEIIIDWQANDIPYLFKESYFVYQ